MLGQAWGTEGVSERWYQLAFLLCVPPTYFFSCAISCHIVPQKSEPLQPGSTDQIGSGQGGGRLLRPIASDQDGGWARRLINSDQHPLWSTHHLLTERVTHPSFLHTDDYSVSKLTLCWTFLSPTICVSTVGKKEVDDWADYQKLFFAFRGRWSILPHIFILLRLIFILIEKHRSKYFRPSTHFSHMLRRSQYLIVSLCTWNLCPSFLTIEFAISGRDQTSFLTFVFHLALELWAWTFFATGWKFMADIFLVFTGVCF